MMPGVSTIGFQRLATRAGRVITHVALLIGCGIFAFPFVWLVSTSFKYDEEIFVYPPRWVPAVPPAVERSPFVTTELLGGLPPDECPWDGASWKRRWPAMAASLWELTRDRVLQLPGAGDVSGRDLQRAVVHGMVEFGTRSLPPEAWSSSPEVVATRIADRIDAERLGVLWESVHRAVEVRAPSIQSVGRDYLALPPASAPHVIAWQVVDGGAALGPARSHGARWSRQLSYSFGGENGDAFAMRGEFPLPMPADEVLGFILPLRQDRTWHAWQVEVELGGRRYRTRDAICFDQYRWQEVGFKLAHLDDGDERDLGIWPLVPVTEMVEAGGADSDTFRVTLTVERAPRWRAAWRKYTHHYKTAQLATEHWWSYVANSVYLVVLSMLGQALSCSMVAYAFARRNWPGRDVFFGILLATMMLPPQVTMIPVFMIFEQLGWYNTLRVLWGPSFLGSAFFIFLLRQFMKSIPDDLEDAAKIDGCSFFGIYWRIILPLVKPALAAVCIFTFMNTWNDFMGPLIYINDQRLYPLALGLFDFRTEHQTEFGMLMAASTLMTLPVIALFFLAQRYFIQGVTLTGMKG